MNLVETWVTNISKHEEISKDGCTLHLLVADFNCYGRQETQVEKWVTNLDYKSIVKNGYYLT